MGYNEANRYSFGLFSLRSGTTLNEHLYMGNPFITLSNRPGVGKIGASLLTAIGRGRWIAVSEEEYIQKAVNLASDINKLATIRRSLRRSEPIIHHRS